MIRRTRDAAFLNSVINDPKVRSRYVWPGVLDLEDYIADQAVLAFEVEHGGFLFKEVLPHIFDAHVMFRRPATSAHVLDSARTVRNTMFEDYGAICLHLGVARGNWPAKRLATRLGFARMGTNHQTFNGELCEVTHYALTKESWRPN